MKNITADGHRNVSPLGRPLGIGFLKMGGDPNSELASFWVLAFQRRPVVLVCVSSFFGPLTGVVSDHFGALVFGGAPFGCVRNSLPPKW